MELCLLITEMPLGTNLTIASGSGRGHHRGVGPLCHLCHLCPETLTLTLTLTLTRLRRASKRLSSRPRSSRASLSCEARPAYLSAVSRTPCVWADG